ncbi:hypothetical protein SARC_09295 [Sphaeroforma arctica JP610]|uniref:Sugar phosphate transporter domain-containing protein n=1 Tax=Sphaeroforma arctica JP610 TaxID=667725 RepID=A0A0L0FNA7_9EUKA|nr:hypothetical protein SARC_09295 [Sphaeroforma arctica JP610]KNC78267.1 hypothetical protein SARC_09295 [Sphaeroforma arctica JP610]|eukprot:XP_014152169.1 hypothetical protein SARC_09295 [Sphaeroforma arctica JP610]
MRVENGVDWLCGRDENSVVKREGVSYYTRTAAFTIFWWVVSVTVIIANKYILSTLGFRFPFFITFIANLVILIGAFLLTRFKIANADPVSQDQLWLLLYPAGALTSLQIGLDNLSLVYLSVSVHVVFQSLTPLVQLLVGILCGLEHWQRQTAFALLGAGVGMALSIFGESETGGGAGLSFMGVAAVLVSMLTSTLRSVMQQAMVQGAQDSGVTAASNKNGTHRLKRRLAALTETRLSPLTVLLYKSPMCVAVSGVISLLFESRAMYNFDYSETPGGALILCLSMLSCGVNGSIGTR